MTLALLPYVQPAEQIPPWPPTGEIPTPECRACGWVRTDPMEPDGCLGWMPHTRNACCGHGRLYEKDGELVQSTELFLTEGLILHGGPLLHRALDAWRAGDPETFAELVAGMAAYDLREWLKTEILTEARDAVSV